MEWILLTKDWPDYGEHRKVLIFTEGVDFAGEQYFLIDAEELYGPTVSKEIEAATHYMIINEPK